MSYAEQSEVTYNTEKKIKKLEQEVKSLRLILKYHGDLVVELHETKLKLKYYQDKYGYQFKSDGKTLDT